MPKKEEKKIKVLHIIPKITFGGAENIVLQLCESSSEKNFSAALLSIVKSMYCPKKTAKPKVYIIRKKTNKIWSYLVSIQWVIKNNSFLKKFHIIHLHLTQAKILGIIILLLKKIYRQKNPLLIETYHAAGMQMPKIQEWLNKKISSFFDGLVLVANDNNWADFDPKRFQIIRNSFSPCLNKISQKKCNQFLRNIGVSSNRRFCVGTLGLFRPERRPLQILEVFFEIAIRTPSDVHFIFSGDGILKNKIFQRTKEKNLLERIHFPGLARNAYMHFSVMDLCITLNTGSSTGVAGLESIHMGVPAVGLQIQQKYNARSGDLIWSSPCPRQVAEKAVLLLSRPRLLSNTASRQKKILSRLHVRKRMVLKYEMFYRRVLAQN